jgi:hypothetical protein
LAAVLSAPNAVAEPAPGPAGWLFDPTSVVEIGLGGLSPAEIDALEAEPDEYQRGTFVLEVGGVAQGPPLGEVGIRLKGSHGSFRPLTEKAAFKIKFNEYVKQTFFGLKKLTLNNMVQDPSMLHETLAYELFRSLGVAASRTGFAFVRLNGEDFGLHLNVETLDSISLPRWFASTRHLYEAGIPGLDVVPGSAEEFEVDEGDEEDITDLEALIAAADNDEGDWSDGMAAVADLAQMTRMWAVERYIGHWDGYAGEQGTFKPNNYYLHSGDTGPEAGRFTMMPWGPDQTWVDRLEFDQPAGGVLFNRCLADASCRALYVDALRAVRATVPSLDLDAQATQLAGVLAPWQAQEGGARSEYTTAQFEEGVDVVRAFIADRPDELAAWLGPEPTDESEPTEPIETGDTAGDDRGSPAQALDSPAPPASSQSGASLLRLDSKLTGAAILRSRLHLSVAGELWQTVTIKTAHGSERICTTHVHVAGAGALSLRCRLSKAVRHRLRQHGLKLHIAIRFEPEGGETETIRRKVFVSRHRSS